MLGQRASERRVSLGPTLRGLAELIRLSGRPSLLLVALSIALTAIAAIFDAASLTLLRRGLSTGTGDAGFRLATAFLVAALVASVVRLAAQRKTVAAQYEVNRTLALRAFRALQQQGYAEYLRRGASEGFAVFERLQLIATFGISPLIGGAAALLSAILILIGIMLVFPLTGVVMAVVLVGVAAESLWRRVASPTASLSTLSRDRSLLLYEARTAFRHIFLANAQQRMSDDFARAESEFRFVQAQTTIEGQSSRHAVELAGLVIALVLLIGAKLLGLSGSDAVPLLGVVALGAFRLLPQVAAVRSAIRMIARHADVTDDVRALLDRSTPVNGKIVTGTCTLTRSIVLDAVSLNHPDRPRTLNGLHLTIDRGARIGIMGPSGVGKSSLLDIVCGALAPDSGTVRIDDVVLDQALGPAWRERIGIVSQNPVLLGRTLREAIVFPQAVNDIDPQRFAMAQAAADVAPMVAEFPLALDTPVGEASSLLSGGQRQRIALAHAIYRAHDLLVLDEATGQLDADSEAAIVAAVAALPRDITILMASHRPALFACCDKVYRFADGQVVLSD